MTLLARIAATVGVAGVGSLTGCYFGGVFDDTPWVSLKTETGYDTGKLGASGYSIYLLAVHGTKGKEQNFNEAKWRELHKRYLADLEDKKQMSTEFADGKVDKKTAYAKQESNEGGSDPKALNLVCKSIYGKGVSDEVDFSKPSGDKNNKHKLAEDLLKYCSPLGQKPVTVEKDKGGGSYGSGKIGEVDKGNLASTRDPANYYFWEAQQRWFEGEASVQSDNFFGAYFGDVTVGVESKKALNTSLKKICERAYFLTGEETSSTSDNPKKSDVKKYCSFRNVTSTG